MSPPEEAQLANVLSILSPTEVHQLGELPNEAIVGVFLSVPCTLETFRPNPRFVPFLHHFLGTAGPADAELLAAAASQGSGWIYLIDARTPEGPQGRVPTEDIIGGFKVKDGKLVAGGYQPNEVYRGFTASGLLRLSRSLRARLFQAIHELVRRRVAQ